jgi:hopanoid biosynthesis associated radical SAM protein HpnH
VFDRAVAAIRLLRARGFRVNVNTTLFDGAAPDDVADFFDYVTDELGVAGITVSPGYAYERAPDQEHFLNRRKTKELFRAIFRRGQGRKRAWQLSHSSLYLDFLAGNQQYRCTPWGNPTRNVFGWQRPCYLLAEGHAASFKELMAETDWDSYGTGSYEKCANCMAHCGYEATAVSDAIVHPLKALLAAFGRTRTEGPMAPEIPLDGQRPAALVHDQLVSAAIARLPERQKTRTEHSHAA